MVGNHTNATNTFCLYTRYATQLSWITIVLRFHYIYLCAVALKINASIAANFLFPFRISIPEGFNLSKQEKSIQPHKKRESDSMEIPHKYLLLTK
jgi:hypothetical protein